VHKSWWLIYRTITVYTH